MTLLAEPAGRLLECTGNRVPRGMTVQDRTRLIGQLPFFLILQSLFDPKLACDHQPTTLTPSVFFTAACYHQFADWLMLWQREYSFKWNRASIDGTR